MFKSEIRLTSPKNPNSRCSSSARRPRIGFFGLYNHIFDLNTSSCGQIHVFVVRDYSTACVRMISVYDFFQESAIVKPLSIYKF